MSGTSKDNVIPFPARVRAVARSRLEVWSCSCGGLTFFLLSDGSVQCSDCLERSRKMTCSAEGPDAE